MNTQDKAATTRTEAAIYDPPPVVLAERGADQAETATPTNPPQEDMS